MTEAPTPNTIPGRLTEEELDEIEVRSLDPKNMFRRPSGKRDGLALIRANDLRALIAMARSRSDEGLVEAYARVIRAACVRFADARDAGDLNEIDLDVEAARACIALEFSPGVEQPSVDVTSRKPEPSGWRTIDSAPRDGTHVLACNWPNDWHGRVGWGFNQAPPKVVHWWSVPGEEGFYLSSGGGLDDQPTELTHWTPIPSPPSKDGDGL